MSTSPINLSDDAEEKLYAISDKLARFQAGLVDPLMEALPDAKKALASEKSTATDQRSYADAFALTGSFHEAGILRDMVDALSGRKLGNPEKTLLAHSQEHSRKEKSEYLFNTGNDIFTTMIQLILNYQKHAPNLPENPDFDEIKSLLANEALTQELRQKMEEMTQKTDGGFRATINARNESGQRRP